MGLARVSVPKDVVYSQKVNVTYFKQLSTSYGLMVEHYGYMLHESDTNEATEQLIKTSSYRWSGVHSYY